MPGADRMTPGLLCVDLSEFGSEEKQLGRIIHPYQNDQNGAGGAVCRGVVDSAEIDADQLLTDGE